MRDKFIQAFTTNTAIAANCAFILIFIVTMNGLQQQKELSYLALGDSYTIGEKVSATQSFPAQVADLLRKKGVMVAAPAIIAKTGWTTGELLTAMKGAALLEKYDLVTLLIGVNNQYRGLKVEDYIPEFEMLLKEAIRLAGNDTGRVVVLSIPDWGVTPFAEDRDRNKIAREINAYNAANLAIAQKYHVHYIDITPATRKAANDRTLITEDGLHPSAEAYAEWALEVEKYISEKLTAN